MNTHSHQRADPPPPSGANTRQRVSSACRCADPRDRSTILSASGASRPAIWAHAPARVAGEISAPWRESPVTSEFCDRPATNRSTMSIARNACVNRPLPIAFAGPGAVTVNGPSHRQVRLYRRRRDTRTITRTRQSSCSTTCSPNGA